MKRYIAVVLALLVCPCAIFGCGSDPTETQAVVYTADEISADIYEFHNNKMKSVYQSFDAVTAEVNKWNSFNEFTNPNELADGLNNVVLPKLADILGALDAMDTPTPETTELKSLYRTAMEKYNLGYSNLYSAFVSGDEAGVYTAYSILEESETAHKTYTTRLDELIEAYNVITIEGDIT